MAVISNLTSNTVVSGKSTSDSITNTGSNVTINGAAGNDSISNSSSAYVVINGDNGNDSIVNGASFNVTMNGGDGDDTIKNNTGGVDIFISGGIGNDSINNAGSKVTIDAGQGNDIIYNDNGVRNSIVAGEGNDSVRASGTYLTIDGGNGNDTILGCIDGNNRGVNHSYLKGGTGDDLIQNYMGNYNTICGGLGNDTIEVASSSANGEGYKTLIEYSEGDGHDVINNNYNALYTIKLLSGKVNSTVKSGSDITINIGTGSITLKNTKDENVTLSGNEIEVNARVTKKQVFNISSTEHESKRYSYDNATISSELKKLDIDNEGANVLLKGLFKEAYNYGTNSTINGASNSVAVSISNKGTHSIIYGSSYKDTIINYEDNNTINAGANSDTIFNFEGNKTLIYGEAGHNVIYNGYNGNNVRVGNGNEVTIVGGTGKSYIYSYGDYNSIIGGGSQGTVNSYGSNVTIEAGSGNDSIRTYGVRNYVNAGASKDTILNNAVYSTILGGSENDSIYNAAKYSFIDGGFGYDDINNNADDATIFGSFNDDRISLSGAREVIQYASGDGNDIISGYDDTDTIQIIDESPFTTTTSGDDVIIKVDTGSMTLKNAVGKKLNIVSFDIGDIGNNDSPGDNGSDTTPGDSGSDTTPGDSGSDTTPGDNGSDTTPSDNGGDTTPGDGDNDTPSLKSDLNYIKFTNKHKSTYTLGDKDGTVDGSEERTTKIKIIGNDENNVIIGGKASDTFTGGAGVDTFVSGSGKDYVTDYAAGEVVSLTGDVTKVAASGKNVTLTSNKGTMILTGANGKKVTFVEANGNTIKQTFGVPMINVVDGDGATINTANDAAVITLNASTRTQDIVLIGNAKANTIIGGSGDDELTGGKGKDVFVYNGGNDIITDYKSGEDTIKLDGVTVKKAEYVGESNTDLCMTFVEGGTLTIENVIPIKSVKKVLTKQAPQKINIITNEGVSTSQIYNLATVSSGINTMSGGSGVDSLYGFIGDEILIGGKGNDKFIYSSGNDTITDYTVKQDEIILNAGSANNYTVVGDDAIFTFDSSNSLTVKNVLNKTIKINGADVNIADPLRPVIDDKTPSPYNAGNKASLLDASKRKKAIEMTANSNDNTLIGGKGNDTLTGGTGADTFVYTTGYGNDVIKDYSTDEGDIIRLGKNTAITGVSINRDDMILTVGKGKITIEGGASQTITIIDDNNIKMTYEQYRPSSGYMERWFMDNSKCEIRNSELESIINNDETNVISNDYNYDFNTTLTKQLNQTLVTNSIKQK